MAGTRLHMEHKHGRHGQRSQLPLGHGFGRTPCGSRSSSSTQDFADNLCSYRLRRAAAALVHGAVSKAHSSVQMVLFRLHGNLTLLKSAAALPAAEEELAAAPASLFFISPRKTILLQDQLISRSLFDKHVLHRRPWRRYRFYSGEQTPN